MSPEAIKRKKYSEKSDVVRREGEKKERKNGN
jgi:hypothetical protein